MKIVNEFPPNYERIKQTFEIEGHKPIFAWGNILYNPHNAEITEDLRVHEETHEQQQKSLGAEIWWDMYLTDPAFRLRQEVQAYQNQYKFVCEHLNREYRRQFLKNFAKALSSGLYGNLLTKEQAEEVIKC